MNSFLKTCNENGTCNINEILDDFDNVVSKLESLYSKGSFTIKFEELQELDLYEKIELGTGSISWLVYKDDERLIFDTIIYWNGIISKHDHDCLENIKVLQGRIENTITSTMYSTGDFIQIPKFQPHCFLNVCENGSTAILSTEFIKPQ